MNSINTESINIGGVECRVKRSVKRKSVCIRITADGIAEMLVPSRMNSADLRLAGEKYSDWIKTNRAKRLELNAVKAKFTLSIGGSVRFLGRERIITEFEPEKPADCAASFDETALYVPRGIDGERLRIAVIQAYHQFAREYITARTIEIAANMGLNIKLVKINSAKTHWASVSKRGMLNFTWYSVMGEPEAVDYIIVHELCHMLEFNHSPRFWAHVGRYCPDYKRWKLYLRELWRQIQSENWD